jgi:predicted lipid-binding transport protein (Tim44 family)
MRRMGWIKVAAIAAGILIGFLVVGSVIGAIFHILTQLVIVALVVGAVAVAVKVARSRRQVSGKKAEREVRDRDYEQYSRPLPRSDVEPAPPSQAARPAKPAAHDVDDELARLKREMGS